MLVTSQKELSIPSNRTFPSRSSWRQFPLLVPKKVGLGFGAEVLKEFPGKIWFSNDPYSAPMHTAVPPTPMTSPSPRFRCALGTRCIFENISWLMFCASHLHHDFANHCPQVHLYFPHFSQLPPGGERCQFRSYRPPRNGRRHFLALSCPVLVEEITNQYGIFPIDIGKLEPTSNLWILLNTALGSHYPSVMDRWKET